LTKYTQLILKMMWLLQKRILENEAAVLVY